MSYLAQSKLTEDHHLVSRVAACAATRGIRDARPWAAQHMWLLSAQPGWAAAYADATAADPPVDPADWVPHAGADPNVITDGMILTGVEAVIAQTAPPAPPDPPAVPVPTESPA